MDKKVLLKIYLISFSFLLIFSCNKDYYSVGIEIFEQQFVDLKTKTFPVYSYQQSLDKVQTNNISSVQLSFFTVSITPFVKKIIRSSLSFKSISSLSLSKSFLLK